MNTSPLILLSKIGLLDLLRAGDLPVIVPQGVLDEIARHGPVDQSLLQVRSAGWLQVAPDLPIPPSSTPIAWVRESLRCLPWHWLNPVPKWCSMT